MPCANGPMATTPTKLPGSAYRRDLLSPRLEIHLGKESMEIEGLGVLRLKCAAATDLPASPRKPVLRPGFLLISPLFILMMCAGAAGGKPSLAARLPAARRLYNQRVFKRAGPQRPVAGATLGPPLRSPFQASQTIVQAGRMLRACPRHRLQSV